MSIRVHLSLAEHFLNWYPAATALYIRGERGKDHRTIDRLHKELFDQLCEFFDKYGVTTLRNDLHRSQRQAQAWQAQAWRAVWQAQCHLDRINSSTINPDAGWKRLKQRLDDAVELAEGLDR